MTLFKNIAFKKIKKIFFSILRAMRTYYVLAVTLNVF